MPPPVMDEWQANLEELTARLSAPCWGVIATGAEDFRSTDEGFERWLAGQT
jgi:hypothetical protein